MLQKGSYVICVDNNGVLLAGVFHLYGGFYKKYSIYGYFLKVSVKKVTSVFILLKKSKFKAFFVLSKKNQFKSDGASFLFKINSVVLLKRRMTPLGKELSGPINFNVFRKRFMFSFAVVL